MSKEKVLAALSTVEDPDFKKDLVTLKMIDDLEVSEAKVSFTIVLTTPACPLKDKLKNDSISAVKNALGDDIEVEVDFSSQVTTTREDTSEMLRGIKNIIAVSSGKGGVGKSTVATNLAVGLGISGAKVGLLDADIHGPSIPVMMNLEGKRPEVEEGEKIVMQPLEQYGIKTLSIGMLIDEKQPIVWRGPMLSSALKQLFLDTNWGELDYLVIDLPPGTGDIHLTLAQQFPITGVVMVTTPQKVALADVQKSMEMYRQPQINIPLIGVVENMSYFIPREMPDMRYPIFGKGGGQQIANTYEVPLLGQIPLTMGISDEGNEGKPAVLNKGSEMHEKLIEMVESTAQQIAILNSKSMSAAMT